MPDGWYCVQACILLLTISTGCGEIRCLSCKNTRNVQDCLQTNVTCSGEQMCFMDRTLDQTEHQIYNAGCRTREVCKAIHSQTRDLSSCSECCNGEADVQCNRRLCGVTNDTVHKLRCLSCDGLVRALSDCTTYSDCGENEWCSTSVHIVKGILKYLYRCSNISECSGNVTSLQPVGNQGIVVCRGCCQENKCNKQDCYELTKETTVKPNTSGSTAPASTETTTVSSTLATEATTTTETSTTATTYSLTSSFTNSSAQ